MDPLTQFVELLRPKALLWKHMEGRGDWAWRFPAESGVILGLVTEGSCHLEFPGQKPRLARRGDYVLMVSPSSWVLRGGDPVPAIDYEAFLAAPGKSSVSEVTRIIGGHFVFDTANADLLAGLLSPLVHVHRTADGAGQVGSILGMIDNEVSTDQPGQALILRRLLEILLILTLRSRADSFEAGQTGMLVGLADPQIASALRAFHADVKRDWTVEALATCAGMSRSVFAERFRHRVGEPPITYLLNWRMALAKDALRFSDHSLDEIALAIGYGSASAFSTAFSRTVGQSPARYAQDCESKVDERLARLTDIGEQPYSFSAMSGSK